MLETFRLMPGIRARILSGPLYPHIDPYLSALHQQGYTRNGIRRHVLGLERFGTWLNQHALRAQDIDEAVVERFVVSVGRISSPDYPCGRIPACASVAPLFAEFLWTQGLADRRARPPSESSVDPWLRAFDEYLDQVKGLRAVTRKGYLLFARRFLKSTFGSRVPDFSKLGPDEVVEFVRVQAAKRKPSACRNPGIAVRAFLRFLTFRGEVAPSLVRAVPTVRQWRHAGLPAYLSPEEVERVLAEARGPSGLEFRNRAILLLLARLGLRASDVAALQLEDVDWRQGLLHIRSGKTNRPRCLPLTHEVGEALANYLLHARPGYRHRRLLLRVEPPLGPLTPAAISWVAQRALAKAGIKALRSGAHVFRHSAATHMLRRGASFKEIADVLGHARLASTAIYAKLDVESLAHVALPWPGAEQ